MESPPSNTVQACFDVWQDEVLAEDHILLDFLSPVPPREIILLELLQAFELPRLLLGREICWSSRRLSGDPRGGQRREQHKSEAAHVLRWSAAAARRAIELLLLWLLLR